MATQAATAPPAPPTGLVIASTSLLTVNLAWTDESSNEAGFELQRSPDGGVFATVAADAADVTSYQDVVPLTSLGYTYRVRARNSAGTSAYAISPAFRRPNVMFVSSQVWAAGALGAQRSRREVPGSGWPRRARGDVQGVALDELRQRTIAARDGAGLAVPGPGKSRADADTLCTQEAHQAGLSGDFLAALATTTSSVASRFSIPGEEWVRPDGVRLAQPAASLLQVGIQYLDAPPVRHADGSGASERFAYIGASDLTVAGLATQNCNDYTSSSGDGAALISIEDTGPFSGQAVASSSCSGAPVLCLQQ